MIAYRATLDVPASTLTTVSGWIAAHRRAHDLRPAQRAATSHKQAMLVLRWLKDATRIRLLAHDTGVSIATAYRYLHEALAVIASHAPHLEDVIDQAITEEWDFVCLDGTLIATDKCSATNPESGYDLWYSGKHKQHGGNVQVLCNPSGYPVWVGPVEPGSTHDITAARRHAFPRLYSAAAAGLPTLTDKGYEGAGIGIMVPVKGNDLGRDIRARNRLISHLRAPSERANALLKQTWRGLQHVTLDPWRITEIVAAGSFIYNKELDEMAGEKASINAAAIDPPLLR